jgi:hypothetical protein
MDPAVVVSQFNGLLGRPDQELMLALAIRAMGVEPVKDVMYFQPSGPKLEMDSTKAGPGGTFPCLL